MLHKVGGPCVVPSVSKGFVLFFWGQEEGGIVMLRDSQYYSLAYNPSSSISRLIGGSNGGNAAQGGWPLFSSGPSGHCFVLSFAWAGVVKN